MYIVFQTFIHVFKNLALFSKTLLCNSLIDVITSVFISFLIAPCLMYNVIYPITLDACR